MSVITRDLGKKLGTWIQPVPVFPTLTFEKKIMLKQAETERLTPFLVGILLLKISAYRHDGHKHFWRSSTARWNYEWAVILLAASFISLSYWYFVIQTANQTFFVVFTCISYSWLRLIIVLAVYCLRLLTSILVEFRNIVGSIFYCVSIPHLSVYYTSTLRSVRQNANMRLRVCFPYSYFHTTVMTDWSLGLGPVHNIVFC